MKRILDEDDLIQIKKDTEEIINENKFDENYATSDRKGGAAISTKVENVTTGNFRILLTNDHVDSHDGKQVYQDTDLTYNADTKKIDINVTHADTANYFSEAKKIELSGDVTGSALSNGDAGWNINTFLKKVIEETYAGPENNLFNNSYIDIPYIKIDDKGRVISLINQRIPIPSFPELPEIPEIPAVNGVSLTGDVTGEGTFDSSGNCSIATTSQLKSVKSIGITGDVTGTGEDKNNDGNWTINTTLSVSTWKTSQANFTTGATPTDIIINKDISQNILIACWIRLVGTTREISSTNLSAQEVGNNIQIVVPVKSLLSGSTFTYPMYYPYLKKNSSTKEVDIENGTGDLEIKYNSTNKQIILTIPGYCRGTQFFQGLL